METMNWETIMAWIILIGTLLCVLIMTLFEIRNKIRQNKHDKDAWLKYTQSLKGGNL